MFVSAWIMLSLFCYKMVVIPSMLLPCLVRLTCPNKTTAVHTADSANKLNVITGIRNESSHEIRNDNGNRLPILVAMWSKAYVCGRLVAGIAGTIPTRGWMFVSCVRVLCCPV
jgi:hypothetical protein